MIQVQALVHGGQARGGLDLQLGLRQCGDDREMSIPSQPRQSGPPLRSSTHDQLCLHTQPGQAGLLPVQQVLLLREKSFIYHFI